LLEAERDELQAKSDVFKDRELARIKEYWRLEAERDALQAQVEDLRKHSETNMPSTRKRSRVVYFWRIMGLRRLADHSTALLYGVKPNIEKKDDTAWVLKAPEYAVGDK
jgi:hypothetical protein